MVDELWPNGPLFKYANDVIRPGTDSLLLAYFAANSRLKKKSRAADLGCGSGVISVLLAWDAPELTIDGIELQPHAAALAVENANLSKLSDRIKIIEGDLRHHRNFMQAGAYDIVVSNPPYYPQGSGKRPASKTIAAARVEESCTLSDICKAAGYLMRWGGSLFLVHKPEMMAYVFRELSGSGFEPKRLRFVQHNYSSPPSLMLIESRLGGKASLKVEPPFILTNGDGSDTDEMKAVYRR